jgi:hypothetical protein
VPDPENGMKMDDGVQWHFGAPPPYIITRTAHSEALIVRGTGYDVDE